MKLIITIIGIVVIVTGFIFLSGIFEEPTYSRVDTSHVRVADRSVVLENEVEIAGTVPDESVRDDSGGGGESKPLNKLPETEDVIAPEVEVELNSVAHEVPFAAQAPFGDWSDSRQQDGCEAATALMAVRWARGETLSKEQALQEITAMADWEKKKYGTYVDASAEDTAERMIKNYLKYENYIVKYDITKEDLVTELNNGSVIIVPVKGREMGSPYYTPPGPERHMLLVIGYDREMNMFITNDPGTRHGSKLRYNEDILYNAVNDYPTGDHMPITEERKAMIVVKKQS